MATPPPPATLFPMDHASAATDPVTPEVRGLLGDSMNHLAAALDALQDGPGHGPGGSGPPHADLLRRLRAAERTLHEVAARVDHLALRQTGSASTAMACTPTLRDVVDRAARVFAPALGPRHLDITTTLDAGLADVAAGPIYTALAAALNLALNAIDAAEATAPGGRAHRINLRLFGDERRIVLKVSDTGRGTESAAPAGPESALHLALCHRVADELGGRVTLAPTDPDQPDDGSTLTLAYPAPGPRPRSAERPADALATGFRLAA